MRTAKQIIKKHNEKVKHYLECSKAGICHECGEKLQIRNEQKTRFKTTGFIFKKQIETKYNNTVIFCPNNHRLTHPNYPNLERNFLGALEYNNTLNPEIKKAWEDNYYDDGDCY
jgi:hypothetical protein